MKVLQDLALVLPEYQGKSIANIPPTIARLLGGDTPGLLPLSGEMWQPLLARHEIRRVVLLLVDGMGRNLVDHLSEQTAWLEREAVLSASLTSVFPSTTVNALSCLWTGATPGQHGLVGLELLFPQMGVIGQMLALTPSFAWWPDGLMKAGLDPYTFLPVPGFAELLAAAGVETYAVKDYRLVNSTLSKMHGRGVSEGFGTVTAADMMWQIRDLLERRTHQKLFISAYWPAIDTLSHRYGFDHPAVAAELQSFLTLARNGLLDQLSPSARHGTLVMVTADHGQIKTPHEKRIFVEDHPRLQESLVMRAAGEPHTAYLYVRNGRKQAVLDYVAESLSHAAVAIDSQDALEGGLFGPPPYIPEIHQRIGDVIVTMRSGYSLLSRTGDQYLSDFLGRHGGLTAAEMKVPFYAFILS